MPPMGVLDLVFIYIHDAIVYTVYTITHVCLVSRQRKKMSLVR